MWRSGQNPALSRRSSGLLSAGIDICVVLINHGRIFGVLSSEPSAHLIAVLCAVGNDGVLDSQNERLLSLALEVVELFAYSHLIESGVCDRSSLLVFHLFTVEVSHSAGGLDKLSCVSSFRPESGVADAERSRIALEIEHVGRATSSTLAFSTTTSPT